MSDSEEVQPVVRSSEVQPVVHTSKALVALVVVVTLLLAVSLYLIAGLRGRVSALEAGAERQGAETKVIEDKLHLTNKNIEAGMEALGSKVGMTEEELAKKTADLKAQQERAAAKLSAEQQ